MTDTARLIFISVGREKDQYQFILIFGDKYQYILIFLNTSYVPNSRFVMCGIFLANYYVKDHFQASQLETLVWSDPANLAGEMIKNQNVLIFVLFSVSGRL